MDKKRLMVAAVLLSAGCAGVPANAVAASDMLNQARLHDIIEWKCAGDTGQPTLPETQLVGVELALRIRTDESNPAEATAAVQFRHNGRAAPLVWINERQGHSREGASGRESVYRLSCDDRAQQRQLQIPLASRTVEPSKPVDLTITVSLGQLVLKDIQFKTVSDILQAAQGTINSAQGSYEQRFPNIENLHAEHVSLFIRGKKEANAKRAEEADAPPAPPTKERENDKSRVFRWELGTRLPGGLTVLLQNAILTTLPENGPLPQATLSSEVSDGTEVDVVSVALPTACRAKTRLVINNSVIRLSRFDLKCTLVAANPGVQNIPKCAALNVKQATFLCPQVELHVPRKKGSPLTIPSEKLKNGEPYTNGLRYYTLPTSNDQEKLPPNPEHFQIALEPKPADVPGVVLEPRDLDCHPAKPPGTFQCNGSIPSSLKVEARGTLFGETSVTLPPKAATTELLKVEVPLTDFSGSYKVVTPDAGTVLMNALRIDGRAIDADGRVTLPFVSANQPKLKVSVVALPACELAMSATRAGPVLTLAKPAGGEVPCVLLTGPAVRQAGPGPAPANCVHAFDGLLCKADASVKLELGRGWEAITLPPQRPGPPVERALFRTIDIDLDQTRPRFGFALPGVDEAGSCGAQAAEGGTVQYCSDQFCTDPRPWAGGKERLPTLKEAGWTRPALPDRVRLTIKAGDATLPVTLTPGDEVPPKAFSSASSAANEYSVRMLDEGHANFGLNFVLYATLSDCRAGRSKAPPVPFIPPAVERLKATTCSHAKLQAGSDDVAPCTPARRSENHTITFDLRPKTVEGIRRVLLIENSRAMDPSGTDIRAVLGEWTKRWRNGNNVPPVDIMALQGNGSIDLILRAEDVSTLEEAADNQRDTLAARLNRLQYSSGAGIASYALETLFTQYRNQLPSRVLLIASRAPDNREAVTRKAMVYGFGRMLPIVVLASEQATCIHWENANIACKQFTREAFNQKMADFVK